MEYLKPPNFENSSDSTSTNIQYDLGEYVLQLQNKVAVYNGKTTSPHFPSGVLYITSHRLYYIPEYNKDSSFQLPLSQIINIESQNGTFTASAKIKIVFDPSPVYDSSNKWSCSSCSFINQDSFCLQCNSPRCNKPENTSLRCVACTFDNHPYLNECEICGNPLPKSSDAQNKNADKASTSTELPMIRLSFRGGGQGSSFSSLKLAIENGLWKKNIVAEEETILPTQYKATIGGIDSLVKQVEKTTLKTNQQLGAAFGDIQTLMDRAASMVELATSIAAKIQKQSISSNTDLDGTDSLLKSYFLQLGIDSPITKDAAGSMFHQELAKEIGKVILPLISKPPYLDLMDLMDVYCIFNRARGVGNFISPSDLVKSCEIFEKVNVSLFVKRFPSGVTVLHSKKLEDTQIINSIVSELESEPNGLDLATLSYRIGLNVSIELINIYLAEAESQGKICRDVSPPLGTLIFYSASPFFSQ